MLQLAIQQVVAGKDLSVDQMRGCIAQIMRGEAAEGQIAALLTALHMKGETVDEIVGAATVMREHVTRIEVDREQILDTCGTGGDSLSTFNISTATALVVAACNVPVAKHGNRSFTSLCGSSEVLEALGVNIEVTVATVVESIERCNVGFCYAPLLHPSMRHAMPVRRQLGIRTVFNLLGPLTNPAAASYQLLGVNQAELVEKLGVALSRLGSSHAFVVSGHDGLDEVTLTGPTHVMEVRPGSATAMMWHPADFGLPSCRLEDIQIQEASESVERIRGILGGEPGPCRDVVLANAAAALLTVERVSSLEQGVATAAQAIDRGAAQSVLDGLIEVTQAAKPTDE